MTTKVSIKQIKSSIKQPKRQKLILDSLGLRGINKVVEHHPTPSILGMIEKVKHLVSVEKK